MSDISTIVACSVELISVFKFTSVNCVTNISTVVAHNLLIEVSLTSSNLLTSYDWVTLDITQCASDFTPAMSGAVVLAAMVTLMLSLVT